MWASCLRPLRCVCGVMLGGDGKVWCSTKLHYARLHTPVQVTSRATAAPMPMSVLLTTHTKRSCSVAVITWDSDTIFPKPRFESWHDLIFFFFRFSIISTPARRSNGEPKDTQGDPTSSSKPWEAPLICAPSPPLHNPPFPKAHPTSPSGFWVHSPSTDGAFRTRPRALTPSCSLCGISPSNKRCSKTTA